MFINNVFGVLIKLQLFYCILCTFGRYVILKNDLTDIEWLLKDLEECSNLRSIINSMDTEFDRNALKAVLFATRSRKEIADLGIKEDRAVNFLRKTVTTAAV